MKIDTGGNVQWNKTYGGATHESPHSLLKIDEGGYLLAGFSASYGSGDTDVFLIKTDTEGIIFEFSTVQVISVIIGLTLLIITYKKKLSN